jgi:hypothetical protein
VGGVREQRQRGGEHAGHHLDDHEAGDEAEGHDEPPPVGVRRGHVVVMVIVLVVVASAHRCTRP